MKPEQFIREYGVEKARHVLSGLPNYYTHMTDDARMFISEHNKDLDENIRKQLPDLMRLDDLKRLVELLDIVRVIGPIEYTRSVVTNAPVNAIGYDTMYEGYFGEETKHYYENLRTFTIDQIKDAVAVHESIYGGGDE
ncbi:hypothetical protein NQ804_04330 [Acinetobacter baumannii]|nr:hypothetical protein [Acinetobacter baumannii]